MPEFLGSLSKSVDVMIEAFHIVGEADGIDYGSYSPYSLAYGWMSKVKVPGVELPDDAMYQVVEAELMKIEDYDRILHQGWRDFYRLFMRERVLDDVPAGGLPPGPPSMDVRGTWAAQGIPVLGGGPA